MIKEPTNWIERHGFIISAAALLFTTGFLTWYAEYDMYETIGYESSQGLPDYEATELTSTEFRIDGSVHYQLKAKKLYHFANDDHMELEQPRLVLDEDGKIAWYAMSNEGYVTNQQEEVILIGDVRLERTEPKDPAFVLTTSKLTIFPDREYAHTNEPVVVKRKSDHISSNGVEAWFNSQRVKFLDKVISRHERLL